MALLEVLADGTIWETWAAGSVHKDEVMGFLRDVGVELVNLGAIETCSSCDTEVDVCMLNKPRIRKS